MKPIQKKIAKKPVPISKKASLGRSVKRSGVCFSLVTVSAKEREAYRVPTYEYLLP